MRSRILFSMFVNTLNVVMEELAGGRFKSFSSLLMGVMMG